MDYLEKFARVIKAATHSQIKADTSLGGALTIGKEGSLQVDYAPFDYVNPAAKIALVGITPGRQQAELALRALNTELNSGSSLEMAARAAKEYASFGGAMRPNLIASLDHIGVDKFLDIKTCAELWAGSSHLAHFTSGVMYPTYVVKPGSDAAPVNWNGAPKTAKSPLLTRITREKLGEEIRVLSGNGALIIALGDKAAEAIACSGNGDLKNVITIPHPSGANAERVLYFTGRKRKEDCSPIAGVDKIDSMREDAIRKVAGFSH